ncbi:dynein axonemal heavy chain 12-like isoform X2 [Conger conger]|uniref:dynein axonemal heavy chain 12-like isoform X2 n=1 Tax=Conger conger TaxID=82655 RepID=UPI002A59BDD6|nr:dynein axonemal heavy chain 12-like isoform X2 [Conger conger]
MESDGEDEEMQLMIERSLLDCTKRGGCGGGPVEDESSPPDAATATDRIFTAIRTGDVEMLAELWAVCGASAGTDSRGWSPLHQAATQSSRSILQATFSAAQQGAGQSRTLRGETPLFLTIERGLIANASFLLQNGCSPNTPNEEQDSPLISGAQVNAQAQDSASVLFEAAGSGNPDIITLLLEYGADANLPNRTGHLPIHRAAHRGHLLALERLIPVTRQDVVKQSGMSPLHSAADGGYPQCLELLLNAGYDANHMLHQRVRCNYDDQRKSALYFAVSNGDVSSCRLLLRAGAMPNQDPVSCLQVALRMGNYELIDTLLRHGAHVNFSSRVNPTLFPSGLQYALRDQPMLRMLLNHGYDAQRCFHCPYADAPHLPLDYEGWGPSVIRDTPFCEVITVCWLKDFAAQVVRILLDYVGHVTFCSKLKSVLEDKEQWPEICFIQGSVRSLKHLCRLRIRGCMARRRFSAPVFASCLPLPTILKDYILFSEYDLYGRGSLE